MLSLSAFAVINDFQPEDIDNICIRAAEANNASF